MTPATSSNANADQPPRHKLSTGWKIIYALLLAGIASMVFFVDEWWLRAGVVLLLVFTVLRIFNTEREHVTTSRGPCRYCGGALTEADRECPACDRPVPREQRLGTKK